MEKENTVEKQKCDCGELAVVFPSTRRGLIKNKNWVGKMFCWSCWYREVAEEYLYTDDKGEESDRYIADQFKRFNDRSRARLNGGSYEELTPHDLMGKILQYDGRCALSRQNKPLVFHHIIALRDGGDHSYSNVIPVTQYVNLLEDAIACGYLSPDDERVFYDRKEFYGE